MNKIILLAFFFLWLCFISCVKSREISNTLNKIVVNKTDKLIVNVVSTDVGIENIFSNGFDSISISFVKNSESDFNLLGLGGNRPPEVSVKEDVLYNLVDTSSFYYMPDYDDIYRYFTWMKQSKNDSIYYSNLIFEHSETSGQHTMLSVKIHITDTILQLLQKDYSMLEKFKDYYKK